MSRKKHLPQSVKKAKDFAVVLIEISEKATEVLKNSDIHKLDRNEYDLADLLVSIGRLRKDDGFLRKV